MICRLWYTRAVSEWRLVYYKTAAGRSPVREYIADLEAGERAKVRFDLDLLEAFGLELAAPHVRNVRGKIWELRIAGQSQHRVLYFATSGKRLVLLHAFTKKTSQTPPAEIDSAVRRMADYRERTGQ